MLRPFVFSLRQMLAASGVGLLALLAACGDSTPTVATPAASIAVAGTAAVGAPLANATVSLLCGKGGAPTTAKTLADGTFGMSLDSGCAAPYLLKVVGVDTSVTPNATVTLFAFADAAGNINITPLTDIAAGIVTGGDTSALYDAVVAQSRKVADTWTDAAKKDATTKLQAKLKDLGLDGDAGKVTVDLLQGKFKADGKDPLDALLDKLKAARGGVSLSSLVEQIVQTGGAGANAPWNVLFPKGSDTLKLQASGCFVQQAQGASASSGYAPGNTTFTLKRTTSIITISVDTGSASLSLTPLVVRADSTGSFYLSLASGTDTVGSFNVAPANSKGFRYETKLRKSVIAEAPANTVSDAAASIFMVSPDGGYISNCDVATPVKRTDLATFDLSSRVSTVLKSLTDTVASPALGCDESTLSYQGTYTYSVTPLGDVKIGGVSQNASLLGNTSAYYSEDLTFNAAGLRSANIYMYVPGTSTTRNLSLRRSFDNGDNKASFSQSCGNS